MFQHVAYGETVLLGGARYLDLRLGTWICVLPSCRWQMPNLHLVVDRKARWRRDSGASIRSSCSASMSSQLRAVSLAHAVVALLLNPGPGMP